MILVLPVYNGHTYTVIPVKGMYDRPISGTSMAQYGASSPSGGNKKKVEQKRHT